MPETLITIVETSVFQRRAAKRLTETELDRLRNVLAADPTAGDLIPDGGGLRKLRFALEGRGKRGGARVIYYTFNEEVPLYLLDVYAKNEKDDLTAAELRELAELAKSIAAAARQRRRK